MFYVVFLYICLYCLGLLVRGKMRCCRAQCPNKAKYQLNQEFICATHCPIHCRNHFHRIPGSSSRRFTGNEHNSPYSCATIDSDRDSNFSVSGFTTTSRRSKAVNDNDLAVPEIHTGGTTDGENEVHARYGLPESQVVLCSKCSGIPVEKKDSSCQTVQDVRSEPQPVCSTQATGGRNYFSMSVTIFIFVMMGVVIGRTSMSK
jgi:hypothetical protein